MNLLLVVIGVFAGIAVSLASLYSLAQALLTEGRPRLAHIALVALTVTIMAALQYGNIPLARLLAAPMLAAAIAAFVLERRWFRVFPLVQQLFAVVLLVGWVAL